MCVGNLNDFYLQGLVPAVQYGEFIIQELL